MDHLCVHCFPPVLVSLCHGGRPEPVDPKKTSLQGVEEEMADKVEGSPSRGDDDTLLLHAL
ncbi:unnamed protein product [Musa acuminata subsp. burmannicoides]